MKILGTHEDLIYKNRAFIKEPQSVQDLYFNTLFEEMWETGLYETMKRELFNDFLFDYIYNCDDNTLDFEEYLTEHGYGPKN